MYATHRSNEKRFRSNVKDDRNLHLVLLKMSDMTDDHSLIMEHIPYVNKQMNVCVCVFRICGQKKKRPMNLLTGACGKDLFIVGQADSQLVQGADSPDEISPSSVLLLSYIRRQKKTKSEL